MAEDSRRIAADARRILRVGEGAMDRDQTKAIRGVLQKNYDLGRRVGRDERERELPNANVRGSLLDVSITMLQQMKAQTSVIPNSAAALQGYDEAVAILKDARSRDERLPSTGFKPESGDAEALTAALKGSESKVKATATAKKRTAKPKAKPKPKAKSKVKRNG